MGKKSGPKQPSPAATAAAQSQANKEAIIASANVNRYGTQSPFGSVSWTDRNKDGVPMTQTTTLSPEMQRLFEQEMERGEALGGLAMNRIGQVSQDPFTLDGLPSMDVGTGQEVEQATYDRLQQLMAPGREEGRRALENRMAVMGLPVGSEAYSTEADRFERGIAEADLAAGLQAVQAGRAEQSRLFDQAQRARQQGISETALERTQPLNELAMLLGQSPGLTAPQAPQTAQYQQSAPDIAGMIQQNYNTKAQQQAAKKGGTTDAATALGTAALFSDSRLKSNVEKIGERDGHNIYSWDWNEKAKEIGLQGGSQGVMADEIEITNPECVSVAGNGYKQVDYGRLFYNG